MNKDYFTLAVGSLAHRKLRSWLTMIGIFIGIAAVVALIGLGEGLKTAINSQFNFLGADVLSVTASGGFGPPGAGVLKPLTDKELNKVKAVPGVIGAVGRLLEPAKLEFNKKIDFAYIVSMPNGQGRKLVERILNPKLISGRLLKDGDKNVVLVGYEYYKSDTFGKSITTGSKIKIEGKEFTVIGVLDKKGSFQVDRSLLVNEDVVREIFGLNKDEFDIISARIDPNADVSKIKLDIEKSLRKVRNVKEGEEDFAVQTPASILSSVNSILLGLQIFVYIIAGVSLLVGGIGIMNTMYTAVVERTKEIGIMKSIGATNLIIFTLFFIESGLLGTIGGITGIVLGIMSSEAVAFIGRLALGSELISTQISWALVLGSLLFSFILGSVFGTLPALRAAQLNPVQALRFAK